MKKLLFLPILMLCTLLSGCFSTTQMPQSNAGLSANNAKVYVMRKDKFFNSAVNTAVYVNNNYVGRLGDGGHLMWQVPSGSTTVSVTKTPLIFHPSDEHRHVTFNAKPRKTYYVELMPAMGLLIGGFTAVLLNEQQGKLLLSQLTGHYSS